MEGIRGSLFLKKVPPESAPNKILSASGEELVNRHRRRGEETEGGNFGEERFFFGSFFNGFFDYTVKDGAGEIYKEYSSSLRRVARTSRKFGYLFETEAALCDVLLYKYELGRKTRAAYRKGDLAELLRLAECDYVNTLKALKKFHSALERQWYLENKPSGFDVQDIRLGGLEKRIESCRKRLIAYARGKLDRIEELECEILPFGSPSTEEGEAIYHHVYRLNASCNVL